MADAKPDYGFMQLQLQQAVETFRYQMGLLVQVWGFLIAADAVFLGYGLAQQKALPLLAAGVMPILMLAAAFAVNRNAVPLIYVALSIERALSPTRDGVASSYIRMTSPALYRRVMDALEITDPGERDRAITQSGPRSRTAGFRMRYLLLLGCLAHIVIFVVALTAFGYTFM